MFKNICRSSSLVRQTTQSKNTKGVTTQNINHSGSFLLTSSQKQLSITCLSSRYSLNASTLATVSTKKSSAAAISPALRRSKSLTVITLQPRFRTMAHGTSRTSDDDGPPPKKLKYTNRLAEERSPYLLQHAHNPVDWYPWGEEAFEKARTENKLIFLSIGYSTCHWCHVMARESFENEEIAAIMNKLYVNIKVDREERPDLDRIYMQFVLMLNDKGGWPMSVWLTPDLTPVTAGTYFPPEARYGLSGLNFALYHFAEKWKADEDILKSSSLEVINMVKQCLSEKSPEAAVYEPGSSDRKLIEAIQTFHSNYDREFGHFTKTPKFPLVSQLNFLLHAYIITKKLDVLDMAVKTLQHIGGGGIHDHVFGGFARYSVDLKWHVPHFEKMLYDQGQFLTVYSNAYKITKDEKFLEYADAIFRYITTDLQHSLGGFFAGEDADSLPTAVDAETKEGVFYSWTYDEIKEAIIENSDKFSKFKLDIEDIYLTYCDYYDVKPLGNVNPASDPRGNFHLKNILHTRTSIDDACARYQIKEDDFKQILQITNGILHAIRNQRPRPHLDTKIICSWNSLVLTGLCELANCGGDKRPQYIAAAEKLVKFINEHLYDKERKILKRACYGNAVNDVSLQENIDGEEIDGFLDDYAFLIKGLIDYYKASMDDFALQWAKELQEIQDELFWDSEYGAYFVTKVNAPNIVVRLKDDLDGCEPSGNSIATRNLILLSHYFDNESYAEKATKIFDFYSSHEPFGYNLPEMLSSLLLHENGLDVIAVVGPESENTKKFVEICRRYYLPGLIIVHVNPNAQYAFNSRIQEKFKMVNGQPAVYICHNKICHIPVTDPIELERSLNEKFLKPVLFHSY